MIPARHLRHDSLIPSPRRTLPCLAAAALVLLALRAHADPPPAEPRVAPLPHRHDATFFRMGLGYGVVRGSSTRERSTSSETLSLPGRGAIFDVALGGALADGWIVGGALLGHAAPGTHTVSDTGARSDSTYNTSLTLAGAMTELYPDPAGGFHVGATVGVAWLGDSTSQLAFLQPLEGDYSELASGIGLSLDAGYEVWLARTFNAGALVRLSWAPHLVLDQDSVPYGGTTMGPMTTRSWLLAIGAVGTIGFD